MLKKNESLSDESCPQEITRQVNPTNWWIYHGRANSSDKRRSSFIL